MTIVKHIVSQDYYERIYIWILIDIKENSECIMVILKKLSSKALNMNTLDLVRTGFSKIEPVTCKILTFLPKNTGIKLKTMHARGIYEKVGQAT